MQSTTSVAQGSFLLLPKNFSLSKLRKSKKRKLNEENEEKWEAMFNKVWRNIDKEVKEINEQLFKKVLGGLIAHMKTLQSDVKLDEGVLPCEILLTGTNLPDHSILISVLKDSIKEEVSPHISVLWSRNCGNIKNMITSLVQQIIPLASKQRGGGSNDDEEGEEEISNDEALDEQSSKTSILQSQCNFSTLVAWYSAQSKGKDKKQPLVIFLPDFESFSPHVLSEFILLLSFYSPQVPLVLIFGVAMTPRAVYQSLPRNVLSQLVIQMFKSEPSMSFLNHIIEKIFFSEKCPFRLGTNCTTFLTDIFLFHSFSVQGFVQGFKYCMMEHFYKKNHFALCCPPDEIEEQARRLSDDDVESIRRLPSFQRHVENSSKENRRLLLLDNDHTRKVTGDMMKDIQDKLSNFHVALKCLHILAQDLPQSLGRHLREFYTKAISIDIKEVPEYKNCIKLLRLQSRSELSVKVSLLVELLKLNSLLDILSLDKNTTLDDVSSKLEEFKKKFDEIGDSQDDNEAPKIFESTRTSLMDYIEAEVIGRLLRPLVALPLHEVVLFDDLPTVRRRISGSPRSAIYLALNNPQYYLGCKCCELPHPEAILPTMPDISIVFKLHLEFSKVINLFDWLQAFAACVKPEMSQEETEMDEEIQARFTRAVSELQFLGFIKPSRSKVNYVTRLTGGSS